MRHLGGGPKSLVVNRLAKIDPSYCLICKCYPDGAIAAVDPTSTDRPRQVDFPACSTEGLWAGRALHSPSVMKNFARQRNDVLHLRNTARAFHRHSQVETTARLVRRASKLVAKDIG
jgi:hypothetical protein